MIWQEANYNFAFFDQVPQLDWDGAYQAFLPEVLATESTLEYYRLLQRFIALLQDVHTIVRFPQDVIQARVWSYPWVLVERVDGQAYVRSVGTDLHRQLPVGSLITHIDGTPTERYVRSQVIPYIAASTQHVLLDHAYREALHGQASSAVQIGFVTPDGRRDELSLVRDRGTRADEWVLGPNVRRPRFSVTWPEETFALVAINTFEDAGVGCVEKSFILPDIEFTICRR